MVGKVQYKEAATMDNACGHVRQIILAGFADIEATDGFSLQTPQQRLVHVL
jgi:hypothetical protein